MNSKQSEVTAVSFGGGGKCGAGRHIAAAEHYRSSGIKRWMGTSIGGFIAVLMANGYSAEQMKSAMYLLWRPRKINIVRGLAPKIINPFKLLKGDKNEFQKVATYFGLLDQTEHIKSWCAQHKLEWNNAELVLFDLISRKMIVATSDTGIPLHLAVAATMAVPGIFSPVVWIDGEGKKHLLVDGGVRHCHPTVEGHKTAIVKCMSFPGRDRIWPDSEGDVIEDIGVMPGLDVLFPPSKKEIDDQVEEARDRLSKK
jgi:predicted acylesterase/phospholipase RssA